MFKDKIIVIKGAGDLASGVAVRLWRSGFPILMTELRKPLTIRRAVSFSEAIYRGRTRVHEVVAQRVESKADALGTIMSGNIAVIGDPRADIIQQVRPFGVEKGIKAGDIDPRGVQSRAIA